MNFSDWIVVVSILFAVFLAIFKFDEWELIRLKSYEKFIGLPIAFLLLSGILSYFDKISPPTFLIFIFSKSGLSAGVWSIIWMIIFCLSLVYYWKRFTNQKPTEKLINKYIDYIKTYDEAKFSSLFRKYERYFFTSKDKYTWTYYERIMVLKEWWQIAPSHFKEIVFKEPDRFYELNSNILVSLLVSQVSKIPTSQISNELEFSLNNDINLSEETPILNIFLLSPAYIKKNRKKNIFLPRIKELAEEYFSSNDFLKRDKEYFILKPSGNAFLQKIPFSLIPFYYIQFVNCYWLQVLKTNASVSPFLFYQTWTQNLLSVAPEIESENSSSEPLNLYIKSVDVMLLNINQWVIFLDNSNFQELSWAAIHFIDLKIKILFDIQVKFSSKVTKKWIIEKCDLLLQEMIICKAKFNGKFNPNFNLDFFAFENVKIAFDNLCDRDYSVELEQNNLNYLWLKKTFFQS